MASRLNRGTTDRSTTPREHLVTTEAAATAEELPYNPIRLGRSIDLGSVCLPVSIPPVTQDEHIRPGEISGET